MSGSALQIFKSYLAKAVALELSETLSVFRLAQLVLFAEVWLALNPSPLFPRAAAVRVHLVFVPTLCARLLVWVASAMILGSKRRRPFAVVGVIFGRGVHTPS